MIEHVKFSEHFFEFFAKNPFASLIKLLCQVSASRINQFFLLFPNRRVSNQNQGAQTAPDVNQINFGFLDMRYTQHIFFIELLGSLVHLGQIVQAATADQQGDEKNKAKPEK